jgi:hypothetical protein
MAADALEETVRTLQEIYDEVEDLEIQVGVLSSIVSIILQDKNDFELDVIDGKHLIRISDDAVDLFATRLRIEYDPKTEILTIMEGQVND